MSYLILYVNFYFIFDSSVIIDNVIGSAPAQVASTVAAGETILAIVGAWLHNSSYCWCQQ